MKTKTKKARNSSLEFAKLTRKASQKAWNRYIDRRSADGWKAMPYAERVEMLKACMSSVKPKKKPAPKVTTWRGWGCLAIRGTLLIATDDEQAAAVDAKALGAKLVRVEARLTEVKT